MDFSRIRSIVDQLAGSAAQEITVISEGTEIHLRFAAPVSDAGPGAPAPVRGVAPAAATADDVVEVHAPMPGLVSLSPAAGAGPFVRLGDAVAAGDTLVLIEAMKSLQPVTAPCDGAVAQIRIADETLCEAGQVLVVLRRGRA